MTARNELALLTDLYELTMVQAFWARKMFETATFSLFSRSLPEGRNFLLAAGMNEALALLEDLRFSKDDLRYLESLDVFRPEFLKWLSRWRFRGEVWALPEGTPFFGDEPVLEVSASLPEAQLVESLLMNQVQLPTLVASKASRVVHAAQGRTVIDFGLRRMHGSDAALKAARAFYVAGIDATSNVLAGRTYGIPVAGTMAHSYVQAYDRELDAFRDFASIYKEPVLLVDTYDVLEGIRNAIRLAKELGSSRHIRGVRIDSGDLGALARTARQMLDAAGLKSVEIFVSGGLDERKIERLVAGDYPIDGFGVGTSMGVSEDAPALDIAYKLTAYAGRGRMKLSEGKSTLPCRKQVFRLARNRHAIKDWLGTFDEGKEGEPLLELVMSKGKRVGASLESLKASRRRADRRLGQLPAAIRELSRPEVPYEVEVTEALKQKAERVIQEIQQRLQ